MPATVLPKALLPWRAFAATSSLRRLVALPLACRLLLCRLLACTLLRCRPVASIA